MSYTKKPLEELNVIDDFMISAVASDKDVGVPFCRRILSVLLQREIGDIKVSVQQFVSAVTPEHRGIRMDVEIEECGDEANEDGEFPILNIYDLEPHLKNDMELERHNRFYQAKIDSRYMKSGERDFSRLPNLYILTITDFDPFGYDYMMYRIRNHCEEIPELTYDDGLQYIYFYTGGKLGGSPEIKAMLTYLCESTEQNVINEATREIHQYVNQVKVLPEVRMEYMRFEDIIYYQRMDELVDNIKELLEDYGTIPTELVESLEREHDKNVLKKWLKLAAHVTSIEEFVEKM